MPLQLDTKLVSMFVLTRCGGPLLFASALAFSMGCKNAPEVVDEPTPLVTCDELVTHMAKVTGKNRDDRNVEDLAACERQTTNVTRGCMVKTTDRKAIRACMTEKYGFKRDLSADEKSFHKTVQKVPSERRLRDLVFVFASPQAARYDADVKAALDTLTSVAPESRFKATLDALKKRYVDMGCAPALEKMPHTEPSKRPRTFVQACTLNGKPLLQAVDGVPLNVVWIAGAMTHNARQKGFEAAAEHKSALEVLLAGPHPPLSPPGRAAAP